jgi:hypothetical protein
MRSHLMLAILADERGKYCPFDAGEDAFLKRETVTKAIVEGMDSYLQQGVVDR